MYTRGMKADRSPGCLQGTPASCFTPVSVNCSALHTMGCDCGDPTLLHGMGVQAPR